MKKVLRTIAIVLWVIQIALGIALLFTGEYLAAVFIVTPAILSVYILVTEKHESPNISKYKISPATQYIPKTQKVNQARKDAGGRAVSYVSTGRSFNSSYSAVEPMSKILLATSYIVLDVETTGFSPTDDSIIEVAALKVIDGRIVGHYESLVDPHKPIPPMITRITGISDKMVRGKPDISEVMKQLDAFIDTDIPIVAHNATFDLRFICVNLDRAKIGRRLQYIDTLDLSRTAFPDLENHKLETLISALNLADGKQSHRAMADVEATQKLLVKCQKNLILRGGTTVLKSIIQEPTNIDDTDDVDDEDEEEDNDPGFGLNNIGMDYEAKGEIDCAISYYEEAIKVGFDGTHPYYRLAILYRKQHRYLDELRVCDAALKMLEGKQNVERKIMDFEHRRTAARSKLTKNN